MEREADVNDLVKAAEDVMDAPLTEELEQHLQTGEALPPSEEEAGQQ